MKKIKNKEKKIYDKSKEVTKTTNFLKEILDPNDFWLFIKLGESPGSHQKDIYQIINDANYIANLKDKNQRTRLIILLQNKIGAFIHFIEENVKTMAPLLNYIRFFIINNLLCQYNEIDNTLYTEFKKINMENNYKKMFQDFNVKLDNFIEPFYIFSNGKKIKNEIILPFEIKKEITNIHFEISKMMIETLKYNQSIYNNQKTKNIINEENIDLYNKIRKKLFFNKEIYLQSDEIRNELDLMYFLQYQIECIKQSITFEDYALAFDGDEKEKKFINNDLKNIQKNINIIEKLILNITKLINEG